MTTPLAAAVDSTAKVIRDAITGKVVASGRDQRRALLRAVLFGHTGRPAQGRPITDRERRRRERKARRLARSGDYSLA